MRTRGEFSPSRRFRCHAAWVGGARRDGRGARRPRAHLVSERALEQHRVRLHQRRELQAELGRDVARRELRRARRGGARRRPRRRMRGRRVVVSTSPVVFIAAGRRANGDGDAARASARARRARKRRVVASRRSRARERGRERARRVQRGRDAGHPSEAALLRPRVGKQEKARSGSGADVAASRARGGSRARGNAGDARACGRETRPRSRGREPDVDARATRARELTPEPPMPAVLRALYFRSGYASSLRPLSAAIPRFRFSRFYPHFHPRSLSLIGRVHRSFSRVRRDGDSTLPRAAGSIERSTAEPCAPPRAPPRRRRYSSRRRPRVDIDVAPSSFPPRRDARRRRRPTTTTRARDPPSHQQSPSPSRVARRAPPSASPR